MQKLHTNYNPVILSAIIIVSVNGIAFLYCQKHNKNQEVQRYYKHFEPIKYYVMQLCYTIMILSLSYNMRFLFMNVLKASYVRNGVGYLTKHLTPTLHQNLIKLKVINK